MVEIGFLDKQPFSLLFFGDGALYQGQLLILFMLEIELVEIMGEFTKLALHYAEPAQVKAAVWGFGLALELFQVFFEFLLVIGVEQPDHGVFGW